MKDDFFWTGGLVIAQPGVRLCDCEMMYFVKGNVSKFSSV